MQFNQRGQTLVEILVAITVAVIVLGAFAIATIVSLKNAQFSQNQAQATKLAQEGIDKIKLARNLNSNVTYLPDTNNPAGVVKLFTDFLADDVKCVNPACNFRLDSQGALIEVDAHDTSNTDPSFKRYLVVTTIKPDGEESYKQLTVKVEWTDSSGSHESKLQTHLYRQS